MTEEQTHNDEFERVSRLSTAETSAAVDETASAPDIEQVYEERYFGAREEKPKRRDLPRSYSTMTVSEDERLWASVAHGSVWVTLLVSIITAGALAPLSIFAPLVIYFAFRTRSDYVAFHALQAFVLQLLGTVGAMLLLMVGSVVWGIGLILALLSVVIAVGFILVPLWALVGVVFLMVVVAMPLAMLLFGTIAAVETYNGRDYRYPYLAQWVDRQLAGGLLTNM
jgi:uncharacterized Tic20 family protein